MIVDNSTLADSAAGEIPNGNTVEAMGSPAPAQPASVAPTENSTVNNNAAQVPRACLGCRPNSHPFQDRSLLLEQPLKIGRSVARVKPTPTNAIFDCKVLSRNHAVIWYERGKFYLQDTKSSNGTFVNNHRLSKGSEESAPREVCSGDILQFGVDVMENSKKVTHGCIIATLKLFLPDGKEAKASPTIINSSNDGTAGLTALHLPTQDLYQLNQYIQEALLREQQLETKLAVLQRVVGETESASNDAWKSLIEEDRLLTRVETLESQLLTYGKAMSDDKLREEAKRLMDDKEEYQERAKDTLMRIANEKREDAKKLMETQKSLCNTEDELASLRHSYDRQAEDNLVLAAEVNRLTEELESVKSAANANAVAEESSSGSGQEKEAVETGIVVAEPAVKIEEVGGMPAEAEADNEADLSASTTTLDVTMSGDAFCPSEKLHWLELELEESRSAAAQMREANEAVNAELTFVQQQLCDTIKVLDEKCRSLEELEKASTEGGEQLGEAGSDGDEVKRLSSVVEELGAENERLRAEVLSHLETIEDYEKRLVADDVKSGLETSLSEAESKISELLRVEEKFAEVNAVKAELEVSLSEMREDMDNETWRSRFIAAGAAVPIAIVIIAVCLAYIPLLADVLVGRSC